MTCIAALIVVCAAIGLGARTHLRSDNLALLLMATFVVGFIALGYGYKRKHGPLLFAADGKAVNRLCAFLMGIGTLLGPTRLLLAGAFPLAGEAALLNVLVLALSVPLAGLSAFGGMLIGSMFYRAPATAVER